MESITRNQNQTHTKTRVNGIEKAGVWGFFQTFTIDNSLQAPEEKKEPNVMPASLELEKIATFEKNINAPEV